MKRRDLWQLSVLNVFASPLRSALTVLGIAIGIGAILAVLTLGDAGKTQVRAEMGRLGIDKIWLTAAEGTQLHLEDAQYLERTLDVTATGQIYLAGSVACGANVQTAAIVGCAQPFLQMSGVELTQGRMLYPLEWTEQATAVLMGSELADSLHAAPGNILFIEGTPFCIAGIIRTGGSFTRVDLASAVVLPVQALSRLTQSSIHEILLDVPGTQTPQAVAAMAQNALESQRGLRVEAVTMQVQMEAAQSVIDIFVDVLKWVALICILVGGIGVMNILLVSVRERRREIGIMKSLGAGEGQIRRLFLLEALLYAASGGVLGLLVGAGLINLAGRSIGLSAAVRAGDCAAVTAVAMLVGLVFGVAPASRAARLNPVDALRCD